MHPRPGPWSMPLLVSPPTVAGTASGRGSAQLNPLGVVVVVVGACVVVGCTVVDAGTSVVVTVVVGGAQTPTPSRWQRLRTPRRHGPFRLAKAPQVVAHWAIMTPQAAAHWARVVIPASAPLVATDTHTSAISNPRR